MTSAADIQATTALVKSCATELGFDLVRITTAEDFAPDRESAFRRIEEGLMDGLPWFSKNRVKRGSSPRELLPGAHSVICLGLNYFPPSIGDGSESDPSPEEPGTANPAAGKIARYARGRDYHRVMKQKMRRLALELTQRLSREISARWYVDDGPMLDRAAAARAGLGWFGKNTNILTSELGSWVFLGQIVTDLRLVPDEPSKKSCGSCVRCIDACPTGAIVAPYVIDNARCISFQTIENRGPIPRELRPLMLDWIFGCDICQEVCPVNRKEKPTGEPAFSRRGLDGINLMEILELDDEQFLDRFAGTPIMRAKRAGLQRNACVALGNRKDADSVKTLAGVLKNGVALVRAHAAWALGEIGGPSARKWLEEAFEDEEDPEVREEIALAIREIRAAGEVQPEDSRPETRLFKDD